MAVNKQGQAIFESFEEITEQQAYIEKANTDDEQELNGYDFYEN